MKIDRIGINVDGKTEWLEYKDFRNFVDELRKQMKEFRLLVENEYGHIERFKVKYWVARRLMYPEWVDIVFYETYLEKPFGDIFIKRVEYDFDLWFMFIKDTEVRFGDGWIRVYGNPRDVDPFAVLEGEECFEYWDRVGGRRRRVKECYPRDELMTKKGKILYKYRQLDFDLWGFGGNRKRWSGAFLFKIWDKRIVDKLAEELKKRGYDEYIDV